MTRCIQALLVVGLLAVLGTGFPGCGCTTDSVQPVVGKLSECCCTFEWTPADGIVDRDVVVVLEDPADGLWPDARPTLLSQVTEGQVSVFSVCVDATHPLGATVTMLLRDQDNAQEYGRVLLVYGEPCGPTLQPIDPLDIRSTDCGG